MQIRVQQQPYGVPFTSDDGGMNAAGDLFHIAIMPMAAVLPAA